MAGSFVVWGLGGIGNAVAGFGDPCAPTHTMKTASLVHIFQPKPTEFVKITDTTANPDIGFEAHHIVDCTGSWTYLSGDNHLIQWGGQNPKPSSYCGQVINMATVSITLPSGVTFAAISVSSSLRVFGGGPGYNHVDICMPNAALGSGTVFSWSSTRVPSKWTCADMPIKTSLLTSYSGSPPFSEKITTVPKAC